MYCIVLRVVPCEVEDLPPKLQTAKRTGLRGGLFFRRRNILFSQKRRERRWPTISFFLPTRTRLFLRCRFLLIGGEICGRGRGRKQCSRGKKKRRLISRLRLAGSLRNWRNFLLLLLILRVRAYYVGPFWAGIAARRLGGCNTAAPNFSEFWNGK